jgi:hypothetical protein
MTSPLPQGNPTIGRMCALASVSRAGYYRHFEASAPRQEETGVRDAIQRLAVANRHYGYRRITELLRREGFAVNHKRVLRLMREDNLLCLRKRAFVPATTDSRHGTDGPGRPPLPTRLMAGLAILKHTFNLSDEELCERWLENPYYQYFCGEEFFQHELPFERSSISVWRTRMARNGCKRCCRKAWRLRHAPGR